MNFDCGVYVITAPSGKLYIGQTKSFASRWRQHLKLLKSRRHHCVGLQNACDKYGIDALDFRKIAFVKEENLDKCEQAIIDSYLPEEIYNTSRIASSPMRGRFHSEETKRKMSESRLGKSVAEETRLKISKTLTGRSRGPHSELMKSKISRSNKDRVFSESHRNNISRSLLGRKLTNESKIKISESMKGAKSVFAKRVICIELRLEFECLGDAVAYLRSTGREKANNTGISLVCNGKRKSAYGYTWKFATINEK